MAKWVSGIVKEGLVVPSSPLPEGISVGILVSDPQSEIPLELQVELEAWQQAGANSLQLVEELALEEERNEKR
jgi:hypothetical protein